MIIKKLVIYGYGKWIDTEFELSPDFHLFYGENEAGKSTLMSFIHSVLFGFPTRHSSLSRYEPKESSRYGGKIIIQDKRFGEVSIERIAGKVTGDVTVSFEDGTVGDERSLSTLLYDKNRSFYEKIFTFNLKGIENIEEMNKDQLNRYFLSLGALGNESYLNLADKYKAKASQLFKPTGRIPEINALASQLQKKQEKVEKAKESNQKYVTFIQERLSNSERLDEIKEAEDKMNNELKNLEEYARQKETIEEIVQLRDELNNIPIHDLPEDGIYQLKYLNEEIERYRSKVETLQYEQKRLQEEYRPSNDLLTYQEFEKELRELSKELDDWQEKVQTIHFYKQEIQSTQDQLTETKIRENLPLNEAIPEELTPKEWGRFQYFQKEIKSITSELSDLKEQIKKCEYKMDINNDIIDTIEKTLWPLEEFKKIEKKVNKKSDIPNKKLILNSKKKKGGQLSAVLMALLFIVLSYLTEQPVYLIGVLASFIIYFMINRKKRENEWSSLTSKELNEFHQQKNKRTQWREMLTSNDILQQEKREKEERFSTLSQAVIKEEQEFDLWKKETGQPVALSIEEMEQKQVLFFDLRKRDQQLQLLNGKIEERESELDDRLKQLKSLTIISDNSQNSTEAFSTIRRFIKRVEKEIDTQKNYIKKTELIQRDIMYEIQHEKNSSKKKYQLLQSCKTSNDEAFFHLYQEQAKRHEKEERLARLEEKLPKLDNQKEIMTSEDINLEINRLKTLLHEYREDYAQTMKQMMRIERDIQELEEGGTYSELLQEFENEKSVYQDKVNEWSTLKLAAAVIEKTLHHAKEDKLPQTIKTAEGYFTYLTDGDYTKIVMEDDILFVVDQLGEKWQVKELSRGTVEPLYIALRLAFIRQSKDSIQFPIIVDDSFVNLDASRLEKIYTLLFSFSEENQLIYFSFDQRIQSLFSNKNYTHLNKI